MFVVFVRILRYKAAKLILNYQTNTCYELAGELNGDKANYADVLMCKFANGNTKGSLCLYS